MVEPRACPTKDAFAVGVEVYVDDMFMVRASYGYGGGKYDFDRGVEGS